MEIEFNILLYRHLIRCDCADVPYRVVHTITENGRNMFDQILFLENFVCQHRLANVIVLRKQSNHNNVPTNMNRKTNQTSVFRGPANSLLTEYPVQHRIRHHIGKQLRL